MIEKIKEIVTSYARMANPTDEQKEVAEERLKICMTCEFWAENAAGIEYCKRCGCATKAKIFTPKVKLLSGQFNSFKLNFLLSQFNALQIAIMITNIISKIKFIIFLIIG